MAGAKGKDAIKKFKQEISRSHVLEESDKTFWLQNAESLPEEVLDQVFGIVKVNNELVETYVVTAMKDDPSLVTELRNNIRKIKKNMLTAAEKEQQPEAEKELEKGLANL